MMIKAVFCQKNRRVTDYDISGHAFFSSFGTDIVCAGVSSLTTAITNQLTGIDFQKTENSVSIKNISASLENNILVHALIDGLLDIEDKYPENIEVVIHDE